MITKKYNLSIIQTILSKGTSGNKNIYVLFLFIILLFNHVNAQNQNMGDNINLSNYFDNASPNYLYNFYLVGLPISDTTRGVKWLKEAAKNNIYAQELLELNASGNKKSKAENLVAQMLKSYSDVDLYYNIGLSYYLGIEVEKDDTLAFIFFRKAAWCGDYMSQLYISNRFFDGIGTDINIDSSYFYLMRCVEKKIPEAIFNLGMHYFVGDEIKDKDVIKSFHLYKESANLNNAVAQCVVGTYYGMGNYIERNIDSAIYYYSLSSEQGYYLSCRLLGMLYYIKETGKYNVVLANKYFEMAAIQDDALSQYYLATTYLSDELKDDEKYLFWLEKAAKSDDKAQYKLALMYFDGEIVKKDYSKMRYYLKKSANSGNVEAQLFYGLMYNEGVSVPKDTRKAKYWIKKSAESGYAEAQYNYAMLIINDRPSEALIWLKKAANNGNANAQYNLGTMYVVGNAFVSKDFKLAVKYLGLSANNGLAEGQYNYGLLYLYGYGVKKDYHKAAVWINKSRKQGYKLAIDAWSVNKLWNY